MPNFFNINNSDPKVHQATSPYWVPTMHSVRVYQCVCNIRTSILPVSYSPSVLQPGLRLQWKLLHTKRGCSEKCSYRVWHTSDLRKTTNEHSCFCCYGKEDCKQSNQSWLHHYWNSCGVYSTISKVEPLPSVFYCHKLNCKWYYFRFRLLSV